MNLGGVILYYNLNDMESCIGFSLEISGIYAEKIDQFSLKFYLGKGKAKGQDTFI